MKIGVFWRKNRNIEFQKKITSNELYDDACEEAKHLQHGLDEAGYETVLIEWHANPLETYELIHLEKIDFIFNASSYEEIVFLETFKIPYTGTQSRTVGMDKVARKIIAAHYGVTTPKFQIAKSNAEIPEIRLNYPLFIKPLNGRGSAGIDETNIVHIYDQIHPVVEKITVGIGQTALIEEFIEGRELTVGIVGYKDPKVLPILEIQYRYGRTNTFHHKMNDQEIIICPAILPIEIEEKIRAIALKAYKVLDIADFGRVDLILDKNNIPYFLEVNTFSGLNVPDDKKDKTAHIGYMGYMAVVEGFNQSTFLAEIVKSTIERYHLES